MKKGILLFLTGFVALLISENQKVSINIEELNRWRESFSTQIGFINGFMDKEQNIYLFWTEWGKDSILYYIKIDSKDSYKNFPKVIFTLDDWIDIRGINMTPFEKEFEKKISGISSVFATDFGNGKFILVPTVRNSFSEKSYIVISYTGQILERGSLERLGIPRSNFGLGGFQKIEFVNDIGFFIFHPVARAGFIQSGSIGFLSFSIKNGIKKIKHITLDRILLEKYGRENSYVSRDDNFILTSNLELLYCMNQLDGYLVYMKLNLEGEIIEGPYREKISEIYSSFLENIDLPGVYLEKETSGEILALIPALKDKLKNRSAIYDKIRRKRGVPKDIYIVRFNPEGILIKPDRKSKMIIKSLDRVPSKASVRTIFIPRKLRSIHQLWFDAIFFAVEGNKFYYFKKEKFLPWGGNLKRN